MGTGGAISIYAISILMQTLAVVQAEPIGLPASGAVLSVPPPPPPMLGCDPFLLFFEWDSASIAPGQQNILANVLSAYRREPALILIAGHADLSGPPHYNVGLSQRRAEAVAAWLRDNGVRTEIRTKGYGERRPLVATPDGGRERMNRRVEICFEPFPAASAEPFP